MGVIKKMESEKKSKRGHRERLFFTGNKTRKREKRGKEMEICRKKEGMVRKKTSGRVKRRIGRDDIIEQTGPTPSGTVKGKSVGLRKYWLGGEKEGKGEIKGPVTISRGTGQERSKALEHEVPKKKFGNKIQTHRPAKNP